MATFDVAKLLNKITQDIPGINTVLKALANWDVSALSDVPDGAMQAATDANNRLTIKKKVSGSYTPVAKLMHDVDKLDGYHASASATANTVAVRNASGALPGNITGNAATANTATALAAGTVVPIDQGGLGATTASQSRANLGAASDADFTTHIATNAGTSVAGHVKLDALAADGSNTAAPGGFGLGMPLAAQIPANTDLNNIVLPGFYSCRLGTTVATLLNCPTNKAFSFLVEVASGYGPVQTITTYDNGARFQRTKVSGAAFSVWRSLPNGISDSTATTSSTVAASATAVKAVNDSAVHLTGAETISGDKTFTGMLYQQSILTSGERPSADTNYAGIFAKDANRLSMGGIIFVYQSSGVRKCQIGFPNSAGTERIWPFTIEVAADDTSYATVTSPPAGDNSSKIATTAWVTNNSQAMLCNKRMVVTTSGAITAPVTGWAKVKLIAGGGAGGDSNYDLSGKGGGKGGDTSLAGQTATGGSGGGAGAYANNAAGGGGAGEIVEFYVYMTGGVSIGTAVIGAGGVHSASSNANGVGTKGGIGATFAGNASWGSFGQGGGNGGQNGSSVSQSNFTGYGGNGGSNGTPYGGGGGGAKGWYNSAPYSGGAGIGGANGSNGNLATASGNVVGGNGGPGAIILEYFDPSVTS